MHGHMNVTMHGHMNVTMHGHMNVKICSHFYFPAGALNLITFLNLKTQSLFHHVTFKTLQISLKMSLKAG
jgi:hypothetical protein